MSLVDDLKAYALDKVSTIINTATVSFSGNNYSVNDIMGTSFSNLYAKSVLENASGTRCIFMPGATIPISMTNAQYIALIDSATNAYEKTNDIYTAIIALIVNGTITTTGQVDSNWTSLIGSYTTNRVAQSTIETLSSAMDTRVWNIASRSIVTATNATGFQISSTKKSDCKYDISMSCTATIGGNSSEIVVLEVASTNSTNPSDWIEYGRISNGQIITLAIALQSSQTMIVPLLGYDIPAGYYARIRGIASGTASASFVSGKEKY